jgi:hypothetical protein
MQQLLNESTCSYQAFITDFTAMVKEMMGEEFTARIYKVTKNNSLELDSLVLLKEGKKFAPNIYLLPYFESYTEGTGMTELAERLCNVYHSYNAPMGEKEFSYDYKDMKPYIIHRVVSYDRNRKLLEKVPHIRYLDLAVTFHCLVHDDNSGIGTIRITNEHLKLWNTSQEELHKLAVQNTKKLFPPVIRSMDEVIQSMLSEGYREDREDYTEASLEQMNVNILENPDRHRLYILSNTQGINGATCLLYENVLRKFSDQIQSGFYILPSSIHEVILVPYEKSIAKETLAVMVKDVNRTQVASDEVLSDRVYFYSRENHAVTL